MKPAMNSEKVINIVVAGLGGQGVLKASDVIAEAALRAGFDVKKSEIHGMSQRGGSVASDVRFGPLVLSPMVPEGEADFLVLLHVGELETNRHLLAPGGRLVHPDLVKGVRLAARRSFNVALLGVLSQWLDFPEQAWAGAIRACFKPEVQEQNLAAFRAGRAVVINK